MGLNVGDSIWIEPQMGMAPQPGFFIFTDALRYGASPAAANGSIYANMLRRWHRGDFDHVHSWTQDSFPVIEARPEKPIEQTNAELTVTIEAGALAKAPLQSQVVTIYYAGTLPKEIGLEVSRPGGETFNVARDDLEVSAAADALGREFFSFAPTHAMLASGGAQTRKPGIVAIRISLPSCIADNAGWFGPCDFKVLEASISAFGRPLVKAQSAWLVKANVRPVISTAHGGRTLTQTFADLGTGNLFPPTFLGGNLRGAVMRTTPGAADRRTPWFTADVLRDMGLIAVWPFFLNTDRGTVLRDGKNYSQVVEPFLEQVYYFTRTAASASLGDNAAVAGERLRKHWPELSALTDDEIFCGKICDISQGYFFDVLVRATLAMAKPGTHVYHLWYTHLGSGRGDESPDYYSPLDKDTVSALSEVSNRHYNFRGDVPDDTRIWVLPSSVWIRYLITQKHLAENLSYDATSHEIRIKRWTDPVTNREVPDRTAGTRDLHGVTLYADDAKDWSVVVDGTPAKTVVVNPADETGRASYTIVDDNAQTPILDEIAPEVKETETLAGKSSWGSGDAAYGSKYVTLEAGDDGIAKMCFTPPDLELWNTSYLGAAIRATDGKPLQWSIDLDMADGGRVTLASDKPFTPLAEGATWIAARKPGYTSKGWWYFTQPIAGAGTSFGAPIKIADSFQRPALPLGKVTKVCLNAKTDKGARVDFDGVRALRPSTTGEAPDSRVVAGGRVTDDKGLGMARVPITMTSSGGARRNTSTDIGGYYFFYQVPRNEIAEIAAKLPDRSCLPLRGRQVHILKNEVEIDIKTGEASRCS